MTHSPDLAVAMDWGGTWARAAVITRGGEILWQSRVANPKGGSQADFLETADALLGEAAGWCADRPIAGLGVGVAGPVDAETGTLYDPPNLPALDGVSLKARWAPLLPYPVLVANDASLAALGEFHHGAGRDPGGDGTQARTLVYVTLSTGIGGGLVDRGRMFLGAHGLAAEIGHMTIDTAGAAPRCQCGNRGCFEALASGTAIARIARERLAAPPSPESLMAGVPAGSFTSQTVVRAAAQGDPLAQEILEGVVQALSVGLTNCLHLFDPDLVVLGGGMTVGLSELGLLPRVRELMARRAMSKRHKDFRLVASPLGDAAGMVGAAAMVWQELKAG